MKRPRPANRLLAIEVKKNGVMAFGCFPARTEDAPIEVRIGGMAWRVVLQPGEVLSVAAIPR